MRRLVMVVLLAACAAFGGLVRADDKGGLTGIWQWTVNRDGKVGVAKITLKLEGDRVTGSMKGRNGKVMKVEEGTFKDGEVSFIVPGTNPDGQKMVHRYRGKLDGDTITGTFWIERGEEKFSRKWEAKRSRD